MSEEPFDPLAPGEIADSEVLSQRVCRTRDVLNSPRPKDMGKLSLVRGEISADVAYHIVRKTATPPTKDDGVRHTAAGDLRAAGFVVKHTPNNRNPNHVSISYPGEWDGTVALLFEACFGDVVWHDEGGEDEDV